MVFGSFAASVIATVVAAAAPASGPDALADAITKATRAEDAIVTPADRALINAKCGYAADTAPGSQKSDANFQGGALICQDGRRVDDPETQAMAKRISARAKAYVRRVMSRPAVKAAIDDAVQRRTTVAIRRVAADMEKVDR